MRFRPKTFFIIIATAAVLALPLDFIVNGPRSVLAGFDHSHQQAFEDLKVGDLKTTLIESLGAPLSTTSTFPLEVAHKKSEFTPEELATCAEFVVFENGGNWFYCVGFDEGGTTVLKTEGTPLH